MWSLLELHFSSIFSFYSYYSDKCIIIVRQNFIRLVFKLDELGLEIAKIAFPAAMALTADPIASLIDTAFIGQIGIYSILFHSSITLLLGTCFTLFKPII